MDLIYASTIGRMGNGDRMRIATIKELKEQSKAVSEGERNEDDDNDFLVLMSSHCKLPIYHLAKRSLYEFFRSIF